MEVGMEVTTAFTSEPASELFKKRVLFKECQIACNRVRYIFLSETNASKDANNDIKENIPLYFGSDILHNTKISNSRMYLVHQKFAKSGCATKLLLNSVHLENIQGIRNNKAWFYTIEGLFKVAFELQNKAFQRDCLRQLQDTWLERYDDPPLLQELIVTASPANNFTVTSTSISAATNTACTAKGHAFTNYPSSSNTNTIFSQSFKQVMTSDISTGNNFQANQSAPLLKCAPLQESGVMLKSLLPVIDGLSVYPTTPTQVVHNILHYITKISNSMMNAKQKHILKTITEVISSLQRDLDNDDNLTDCFPYHLLQLYSTILSDKNSTRTFKNNFGLHLRKNVALSILAEYLGEAFSEMKDAIQVKVESFKQENINCIDNIPPPLELMKQLFPNCMLLLIMNWMQCTRETMDEPKSDILHKHSTDQNIVDTSDNIAVSSNISTDHCGSPPDKKRVRLEDGKTEDRTEQLASVYPLAQLILEFANNALVSGVAHVVFTRLLLKY